ncbi:MAG: hypothetical protein WC436_02305 [Candidatus Babeliales bacterium]
MKNLKKIVLLSLVFGLLSTTMQVQALSIFKRFAGVFSTKRKVKNTQEQHAENMVTNMIKSGNVKLQGGWWQRRKQKQALIKKEKNKPEIAFLTGQTTAIKSKNFQKEAKTLYEKKYTEALQKHTELEDLADDRKIKLTDPRLEEARLAKIAAAENFRLFKTGLKKAK